MEQLFAYTPLVGCVVVLIAYIQSRLEVRRYKGLYYEAARRMIVLNNHYNSKDKQLPDTPSRVAYMQQMIEDAYDGHYKLSDPPTESRADATSDSPGSNAGSSPISRGKKPDSLEFLSLTRFGSF